jgi:hypothetical protein
MPPNAEKKLAAALEVEQDLIDAVMATTAHQLHDEAPAQILAEEDAYRAAFRPHLRVKTERRIPSPIFVAALLGTTQLLVVTLPDDTFSTGKNTRDRIVTAAIIEHYRRCAGRVTVFGTITGYLLVILPGYGGIDFGYPFNVTGDPAGPMRKIGRPPEATLVRKPSRNDRAAHSGHLIRRGLR